MNFDILYSDATKLAKLIRTAGTILGGWAIIAILVASPWLTVCTGAV